MSKKRASRYGSRSEYVEYIKEIRKEAKQLSRFVTGKNAESQFFQIDKRYSKIAAYWLKSYAAIINRNGESISPKKLIIIRSIIKTNKKTCIWFDPMEYKRRFDVDDALKPSEFKRILAEAFDQSSSIFEFDKKTVYLSAKIEAFFFSEEKGCICETECMFDGRSKAPNKDGGFIIIEYDVKIRKSSIRTFLLGKDGKTDAQKGGLGCLCGTKTGSQ